MENKILKIFGKKTPASSTTTGPNSVNNSGKNYTSTTPDSQNLKGLKQGLKVVSTSQNISKKVSAVTHQPAPKLSANKKTNKATDLLLSFIPIAQGAKGFVTARNEWKQAKNDGDEEALNQARKKGYAAVLDLGLDVGLLVASSGILSFFKGGAKGGAKMASKPIAEAGKQALKARATMKAVGLKPEKMAFRAFTQSEQGKHFIDTLFELTFREKITEQDTTELLQYAAS